MTAPTQGAGSSLVTVIRPHRGWAPIGLRELWAWRELTFFLIQRDLKVRYKQTAFGVAWALIQPLAMVSLFTLFLGRVSGIRPADVPYPLFALAALIPWTLFAQAIAASANSLIENSNLLTKVYFPRLLLPIAAAASHVVDFLIGLALLAIASVAFGYLPGAQWLLLVPISVLGFLAAVGAGLWLSAINVQFRDVRYAVPFLVQVWFFATPIAYSSTTLPDQVRPMFWLNPITGVVEAFRAVVTSQSVDLTGPLGASVVVTLILVVTGAAFFRRVEGAFADVV